MKVTSVDIIHDVSNSVVLENFFYSSIAGHDYFSRIYFDKNTGELFKYVSPGRNTRPPRYDDSWVEVASDNGVGYNLTSEELIQLTTEYNLDGYGYKEWLESVSKRIDDVLGE